MRRVRVLALILGTALLGAALGWLPALAAEDTPSPVASPSGTGSIIEAPATPPSTAPPPAPVATPAPETPAPAPLPSPTLAPPTTSLSFGVLGGCRPGATGPVSPVLQRIAEELGRRQPEVVIGTGDYVEGSPDPATLERQYQWLFYALQPLQSSRIVPIAFAPGGHDVRSSANARLFSSYFGGTYHSFDRWTAHFIVLDTEIPGQEQRIMGDQWWWLVRDLYQALGTRYIFVVTGRPLFPVAGGRGSSLDRYPRCREALHALLRDYHVSAVFSGGEGLYDYQEREGVRYFITGGAGGALDETAGPGRAFSHYLWVRCAEGGFQVEAVAVP